MGRISVQYRIVLAQWSFLGESVYLMPPSRPRCDMDCRGY